MVFAKRDRLVGAAGPWAPEAGAGQVGGQESLCAGERAGANVCVWVHMYACVCEAASLLNAQVAGSSGTPAGLPADLQGAHGRVRRKAGPRLSRSPPARAQELRAIRATPLQRSFSQHVTSCTSNLVRTPWLRLSGLVICESCLIIFVATSQEGAQPLCWEFTFFPGGKEGGAWQGSPLRWPGSLILWGHEALLCRRVPSGPTRPPHAPLESLGEATPQLADRDTEGGWRRSPAIPAPIRETGRPQGRAP